MNELRRHRFRSMGTSVLLVAPPHPAFDRTARATERAFAAADRRFSRFRSDSELSRVNAAAGRPTRVSDEFAEVLTVALEGAWVTGGLFDPTILEALRAAGYDRDFDQIRRTTVRSTPLASGGVRWSDIRWEPTTRMLRLPSGAGLDFGGVAKGWTVDLAAEATHDLPWAIVDAGGDLCVTGSAEDGLEIAVEDPRARGHGDASAAPQGRGPWPPLRSPAARGARDCTS